MGKKKPKSKKNKEEVKVKAKAKVEKLPQMPLFIFPMTKVVFVILSIGGHLNANEYTYYLDNVLTEPDDDDIDEIINAMEYHENDRLNIAKTLRDLADVIAKSMVEKDNDDSLYLENYQKIEMNISLVSSAISSYVALILKQRKMLVEFHGVMKESASNFSDDSFSRFLKYTIAYQALSHQYMRQLDWEASCSSKVLIMLEDGSAYSHLLPDSINDKNGGKNTGSGTSPKGAHHRLRAYARGYSERVMLDQYHWKATKEAFLEEVLSFVTTNTSAENTTTKEDFKIEKTPSMTTSRHYDQLDLLYSKQFDREARFRRQTILRKATSIKDAINSFVASPIFDTACTMGQTMPKNDDLDRGQNNSIQCGTVLFILLKGESGAGKTYFCDEIETKILQLNQGEDESSQIMVIRPQLPTDFLGPSVGAFENSIISLFSFLKTVAKYQKCILLLDGIEHILGADYGDSSIASSVGSTTKPRDHLSMRTKNIFLTMMDEMKRDSNQKDTLVLCTSRGHDDNIVDRFDTVYKFEGPTNVERKEMIEFSLRLTPDMKLKKERDGLISEIISATIGKSRGEIAKYCREAIEVVPTNGSTENCISRLKALKTSLESIVPDSLKNASHSMIEMRVWSAKELRRDISRDDDGNVTFPLLGDNALESWKQLESIIIAPLCRRNALNALLYGNAGNSDTSSQRKATSSGVLISGDPGVGKTALAYHCAAIAAGYNPSIRLLEVSCTSIIQKEVGGSERNLHKLFETARASAPCIILLDGIDIIAPVRGKDNTTEGTMDRLLSTLLIEMDGVSPGGKSIKSDISNSIGVIGITHNPPSWIDPALLRPGRLEKCIKLDRPNNSARKEIFLKSIADANIDFSGAGFFDPKNVTELADTIVMKTAGKSAAEVIALYENAKMVALKEIIALGVEDCTDISISCKHFLSK